MGVVTFQKGHKGDTRCSNSKEDTVLQQFLDLGVKAMPRGLATDGEQRNSESEGNNEEVPMDKEIVPCNFETSETDS